MSKHGSKRRALFSDASKRLEPGVPFILTGDFNAPAGGEVYRLFADRLADAWVRAEHRSGPECTFGGFKGFTQGARIDWILYRGPFRVLEAETVTRNWEGRYPSDHYPVFALLEFTRR